MPKYVLPKIPVEFLLGYIYEIRFSEMTKGRGRGMEDACSHYREGVAGDWVNHFKPQHKAYFKKNYNDVFSNSVMNRCWIGNSSIKLVERTPHG